MELLGAEQVPCLTGLPQEAHHYVEQQLLGVVREAASRPGASPASILQVDPQS